MRTASIAMFGRNCGLKNLNLSAFLHCLPAYFDEKILAVNVLKNTNFQAKKVIVILFQNYNVRK